MRQLVALLSFWQNGFASNHFRGGKRGERVSLQNRRALLKQFAPQYREVSSAQKRVLLDVFAQATGYHRRYGMWLLNHAEDVLHAPAYARPSHYGPEVQHVLLLAWNAANRICAKRLIPFLPTLIDSLERHEQLHLTRSAATADRLLSSQRKLGQCGLSTTRAGTLLKQQIPIRAFEDWHETLPGFLEADLVAHCGTTIEGGYVYTLTLTDVATGWTECLPLLYRSQTVLAAIQRARTLFPFPILGIDTDNGGEFLNEVLIAYCEQEHISFTRGRPYLKNDQCFVDQKIEPSFGRWWAMIAWWLGNMPTDSSVNSTGRSACMSIASSPP
jgi:hypothetical protein